MNIKADHGKKQKSRTRRLQVLCTGILFLTAFGVAAQDVKQESAALSHFSEGRYEIPNLKLIRQDGTKVSLPEEIDDGRPVLLNFVFTSCTAVCPMLSHLFAKVQQDLGSERERLHMVSISIDPEYDTPARLTAYAKQLKAGPAWQHYTGSLTESVAVQKAFGVFRGNKMNHVPITFLRAKPGTPWLRLEGLISPNTVIAEYRRLMANAS